MNVDDFFPRTLLLPVLLCCIFVVGEKCPRDVKQAEREDPTRNCRKVCADNSDCSGELKTCNCDDLCGMSCFNPAADCQDIGTLANGSIKLTKGNNYGSEARYSCRSGYYLSGQERRKCRSDRTWSHGNNVANCTKGCKPPSRLGNSYTVASIAETGYPVGYVATYKCNTGYVGSGNADRTCQSDHTWTNLQLYCLPISCGVPNDVTHATHSNNRDDYVFGATVTYKCGKGYNLNGQATFRCMTEGYWEPTDQQWPTCEPVECLPPSSPENGRYTGYGRRTFGATIGYECNSGYNLIGPDQGTCNENATWGPKPTCNGSIDATFRRGMNGYSVVSGSWSRKRVQKNAEGLPDFALEGYGTIQSVPISIFGCDELCVEVEARSIEKNELNISAIFGDNKYERTFEAESGWKTHKFRFVPPNCNGSETRLQFVTRDGGANVVLNNIKDLDDSECAMLPASTQTTTTVATLETTSATTTARSRTTTTTSTVRTRATTTSSTSAGASSSTIITTTGPEATSAPSPTTAPGGVPDSNGLSTLGKVLIALFATCIVVLGSAFFVWKYYFKSKKSKIEYIPASNSGNPGQPSDGSPDGTKPTTAV